MVVTEAETSPRSWLWRGRSSLPGYLLPHKGICQHVYCTSGLFTVSLFIEHYRGERIFIVVQVHDTSGRVQTRFCGCA